MKFFITYFLIAVCAYFSLANSGFSQNSPIDAALYASAAKPYEKFPFQLDKGGMSTVQPYEEAFLSTVLDQLRTGGVHINNRETRSFKPRVDFAAAQLILLTRAFHNSQAGVTITVSAWPDEGAAQKHTQSVRSAANTHIFHRGFFSIQVQGNESNRSTQEAAVAAMQSYAPRRFDIEIRPADMRAWDGVNRGDRGDYAFHIHNFYKQYPRSVYRQQAELALIAAPRRRGGFITSDTEACRAQLKSSLTFWPNGLPVPPDAFLKSDTLEIGTGGRSLEDTPELERLTWDLAFVSRDCFLNRRFEQFGVGLKDCTCAPLSSLK